MTRSASTFLGLRKANEYLIEQALFSFMIGWLVVLRTQKKRHAQDMTWHKTPRNRKECIKMYFQVAAIEKAIVF